MQEKLTCKTALKPNLVSEETFERELKLCHQLSEENGGKCGWGVCKDCGVIPLLYKLHKGELIEDPEEIVAVKEKYTGKAKLAKN